MKIRFASDVRPDEWPVDSKTGERKTPAWRRDGHPDVVLENTGLRQQFLHVVFCKDNGEPMWDQGLHWEAGGAVTLPINTKGEIGLVELERPVQRDPSFFALIGEDVETDRRVMDGIGRKVLQAPRGMAKKSEQPGQTAAREAGEEIGKAILGVEYLGLLTGNDAFDPKPVHAYLVRVDETKASELEPDVNEKIFKVTWYQHKDVVAMLRQGADCPILCGWTKSLILHHFVNISED